MAMRHMMARRGKVRLVCSGKVQFCAPTSVSCGRRSSTGTSPRSPTLSHKKGLIDSSNHRPRGTSAACSSTRSAKRALAAMLGDRVVDDETLQTVVTDVEALLNGRPLTHVSTDPDVYQPLTPNYFLIGRASPQLSPGVFTDSDMCSRRRLKHTQVLLVHFRQRWRREYLPTLTVRSKWFRDKTEVKVGELVLLSEENVGRVDIGWWDEWSV
ncbi:uncharacterized protein LOC122391182 [Amphibalanus amphitrite]|nr:uncharacterized protein LOC122379883 [Amphibalanus amphitrite]XP_043218398.1 uncharacterized protein LOC122379883 [Amphibalanus amphitrite]XP_043240795.1 uncharacterized protein LOC122391182 [Amphibalanus amphitrite]